MMPEWFNRIVSIPGRFVVKIITRESGDYQSFSVHDAKTLEDCLEPCDVLLVEGNLYLSGAIKYLTQSTWSHSAMYVGNIIDPENGGEDPKVLIEADVKEGVVGVPLSKYTSFNVRICRPVGLTAEDKNRVISFMMRNLGNSYDLKNIVDLARYLFPTPPVPARFRRKLIALGSGDPTRAICSSLIAQAFQRIHYPILPVSTEGEACETRHSSLFAPRDFDLSPYFRIVKPTLEAGFDYRTFCWAERSGES